MAQSWLDRAWLAVAPERALRRLHARALYQEAARAYDAAQVSRGTKGWRTTGNSANAEIAPALATLRNRSRDLVRNNPWGIKIRRQLPAHIVGTGVTPRCTDGSEQLRKAALQHWNSWAEATDTDAGIGFEGQQNLIAGTIVEAGECLLLWEPEPKAPGGWRTRVLEPDYLDEGYTEASRNGSGQIVNGVEFDAAGRRVAYHLFREHPGDPLRTLFGRNAARIRIDASLVDHVFEVLRPGQVRGVPWLATSALTLRDVDDYKDAERWRKKIAAALAVFVTSTASPVQSSLGAVRSETGADGASRGIERIAPGTIKRLAPGEDVKLSTPPADSGMADYLKAELLAVAAGVGVPYAELTGDLSNANYSSMRLGKIEFWALLDVWQWLMMKPMLLARAWARVQATGPRPGLPCAWSFPRRVWVDPAKEIQAEKDAIRSGLKSQPDAIAERGEDWRELLAETAEFLDVARSLGLRLDTDGAAQAVAAAKPAEEPDDDDSKPTQDK